MPDNPPRERSEAQGNKRQPPTSEHQVLKDLREDFQSAREWASAATAVFDAVTGEILACYLNQAERSEFTTPRVTCH